MLPQFVLSLSFVKNFCGRQFTPSWAFASIATVSFRHDNAMSFDVKIEEQLRNLPLVSAAPIYRR